MRASTLLCAVSAAALLATSAHAQDAADKITIGEAGQPVFPESITTTADGTLYAGSVALGTVFKAGPGDANAATWIEAQSEGPKGTTGVYADEKGGLLWVCYSDLASFSGPGQPSMLRTFSLSDGTPKDSWTFPADSFCNDITTTADGIAYVADTKGARVMRVKSGDEELETWLTDTANLAGVDGISLNPDGELFVNNVQTGKLFRIAIGEDGSAGALTEITTSSPLKGPDGMRFAEDGALYLAENGAGQADVLAISGDSATVTVIKGGYDTPTAVSPVGDTLYIGEAKFSKMGGSGDPGPFYVYKVPIPRS